jgi:hypothetical protein
MRGSRYSIMRKLIIAIGIITAILAVLISLKAKSQLKIIGGILDVRTVISMVTEPEYHHVTILGQ